MHDNVHVLNATMHLEGLKMVNFILRILYHAKDIYTKNNK